MIAQIKKRDGRIVPFDQNKITEAIWKAVQAIGGTDRSLAQKISNQVVAVLEVFFKDKEEIPQVEQIQDLIEKILIEDGHAKTAKAFILYREERAKERRQRELILGKEAAYKNLNFSNNALAVLERRYLLRDEDGNVIESPEDLVHRVAKAVSQADKFYDENPEPAEEIFFNMIANLEFMPNSPCLMNAGTELGQLAACFVIPVEDSIEGIFEALKAQALIHKSGGGTGFSFSKIRPKNDRVRTTSGIASGPISFMKIFDITTEVIKQGGKRRGANMGILRVDHPDILDFINVKTDMKTLTNFNISVAVTDEYMEALEKKHDYPLINPRTGKAVQSVPAQTVFDMIVANAWKNGDPGLVFIDEINRKNPVRHLGEIEATNPCGEQPLLSYESCNLGSINLNKMTISSDDFSNLAIDWKKLERTVEHAVHFLDNVIDVNHYPLPQIKEMTFKTRKIGLGIMGFADILYQMRIPYNSEEALTFGEKLIKFIHENAIKYSEKIAQKRGNFAAYKGSAHEKTGRPMRNACVTTIAPTGTIGMLADASGGLEPNYAISYTKNVMEGTELLYTNKHFEQEAKKRGFYSFELMREIARAGSIQNIKQIPEDIRHVFVTAQDISPDWHVRMQAVFQKWVDSSVSKTINFPATASIEDVEKAYLLAYKLKCKGITIYRDRSREGQVLFIGEAKALAKTPEIKSADPEMRTITSTPVKTKGKKKKKSEEVIPPPIVSLLENTPLIEKLPFHKKNEPEELKLFEF